MKNGLKSESGISGIDIIASIGIIIIFTLIITLVYSNLTSSNVQIQRMQIATNYAVALMEKADKLYYGELTAEELVNQMRFSDKYDLSIDVTEKELEQELVKYVTVEVSFKVGKNSQKIKMEKIKHREVLDTPNKPILLDDMVPVKYEASNLVKTNEDDISWYDYSSKDYKKWALAVFGNNMDKIYIWIPRYAFFENDIKFLFGKGVRYVNSSGNLQDKPENYVIYSDFNDKDGVWIKQSDVNTRLISRKLSSI